MEKIKFSESYFTSNSFLNSLLFSVTWLSSDSGSSWLWITFSLKHFAETFQTKSLFTVIFSVYWFSKHCLHYTFIRSVFCISHNLLKRKKFQKSYQKVCHFIRRLKRCLREGRHLRHIIFLKQHFALPILSYHVSRNIELTPLLYSTNIPFLSAFCSTFHTCTMSKGRLIYWDLDP